MAEGDLPSAMSLYNQVLTLNEPLSYNNQRNQLLARIGLSTVNLQQQQLEEATFHIQKADLLNQEINGTKHHNQGVILSLMGQIEMDAGNTTKGMLLLENALQLQQQLLPENHTETLITKERLHNAKQL